MIELTDQQVEAMPTADAGPPRIINPRTRETFVLVPLAEYRRLVPAEYDDTGWTRDELHAQAWEAGRSIGWEDMDEYDDPPVRPWGTMRTPS